jgi:exodeoxyribonuclease VII large subunit
MASGERPQLGFGFQDAAGDPPAAAVKPAPPAKTRAVSVSELTARLGALVSAEFPDIWVSGEISGAKLAPSGHWYFTLKDGEAQITCACFRTQALRLRVKPKDGLAVLARGRVEVYPARGTYQLIVEALQPQGLGALQAAFDELKKRLAAEGLFDPDRKRPLPAFPRHIGLVTSPSGAAVRDLLNVLSRRAPGIHVRIFPALVQGEGSAEQVVRGLDYFSQSGWPDLVIVARGGGSLEDLWTFNEEVVARAIRRCGVPVIAGIGHETDFTIADFAADLRAPTPSAAAELATAEYVKVADRVRAAGRGLDRAIALAVERARNRLDRLDRLEVLMQLRMNRLTQRLDEAEFRLRRADPHTRLREMTARCAELEHRAARAIRVLLDRRSARLAERQAVLRGLNPLAVLDRGYAFVTADGRAVLEPPPAGSEVSVQVARGKFRASVRD